MGWESRKEERKFFPWSVLQDSGGRAAQQLAVTPQQPHTQEAASDNTNSTMIGSEWCQSSWWGSVGGRVVVVGDYGSL